MFQKRLTEQFFTDLYTSYADEIFRFCYFRLYGERERALDLMQETFLRAWKYATAGTPIDHPRAFLYKIARNLVIDHTRRPVEYTGVIGDTIAEPIDKKVEERLMEKLDAAAARTMIKQLEPIYQEVLLLRYVHDLRPKEIAIAIGESPDVVSVRLHRGVKKLQDLWIKT